MYALYSFFLFLTMIVIIPLYFVKLRLFRKESLFLKERLGIKIPKEETGRKSLWIHAVSVGEVLSLQNLVTQLKKRHPDWKIYFSSLTPTGMQVALEKMTEADHIFFLPLDFRFVVSRFFQTLKPRLFIMAESEFWPNLLREAKKRTQGVLLINGRFTRGSYRRYKKIKILIKRVLNKIDYFLVQSRRERKWLEEIGAAKESIEIVGNLKSEVKLPFVSAEELKFLKEELSIPGNKKIILAGSTRKGEEEKLLEAYQSACQKDENLLLILAPRHPDRVEEVEKLCRGFSFKAARRTNFSPGERYDVLILDTLGELTRFYALCDVAFIGGSLVSWGGHNLLEPAFYRKAVFFGPHMDNFSDLAELFVRNGAAKIVSTKEELTVMFLSDRETGLKDMAEKAWNTLNGLKGATDRTIEVIEKMMDKLEEAHDVSGV